MVQEQDGMAYGMAGFQDTVGVCAAASTGCKRTSWLGDSTCMWWPHRQKRAPQPLQDATLRLFDDMDVAMAQWSLWSGHSGTRGIRPMVVVYGVVYGVAVNEVNEVATKGS